VGRHVNLFVNRAYGVASNATTGWVPGAGSSKRNSG
jgi:hypothetical protein